MAEVPRTHYAKTSDGASTAYQYFGGGDIDVLVTHAVPVPLDLLWDEPALVRTRDRLSRFGRNIWMDFRGWGSSERDLDAVHAFDDAVMDAQITAVLDAVACDRAAMLACGAAGPAAIHYAAAHGDRITSLVLVNSFANYVRDEDCPWGLPQATVDQFVDFWTESFGRGAMVELLAPSRAADEGFRSWVARGERVGSGPRNYAERTRALLERDARDSLDMLAVPTLVIHRRDDKAIRVEAGRYLAAHIRGSHYVELPGDDDWFFVGDVDLIVDEVEEFLTGVRATASGDVVVATVMFTDIIDSTAQQAAVGRRSWSHLTALHDDMVRKMLGSYRGLEIKMLGDGFLATFDSATRAMACATDIISAAGNIGLKVRVGIHTGEVELLDHDVAGLAVSIAKRVCDIAPGQRVLVTDTVRSAVVGSEVIFEDAGVHDLKGVPGRWRTFLVRPAV
jgi:class 3 adenylate cyclase/pimeloyl-ACP methyl ester carboxylesterase